MNRTCRISPEEGEEHCRSVQNKTWNYHDQNVIRALKLLKIETKAFNKVWQEEPLKC